MIKLSRNPPFDKSTRRRSTPAEINEKRARGLCFLCDDKYLLGHVCKARAQLYLVGVEDEVINELLHEIGMLLLWLRKLRCAKFPFMHLVV